MSIQFTKSKKLKRDLLVCLLIIILPFLFYLYTVVPKDTIVWEIGFLKIDPHYLEYMDYYIWLLFVKFFTIGIISIWFITCKHKWRYVLLIPLLFEIYKIFSVINFSNSGVNSSFSFLTTIIVFIPYVSLLIYLSFIMNYCSINRTFNKKNNEEINQQLASISKFNSKDYKLIKKELLFLKKKKKSLDRKEYLTKLISLRDRLTI